MIYLCIVIFFKNPLQFLHFIEQRNKAYLSPLVNPEDELDHLGLYLEYNCYVQYAEAMSYKKTQGQIVWHGYRKNIDNYYSELLSNPNAKLPIQKMPDLLDDILKILVNKSNNNRTIVANSIFNIAGDFRDEHVKNIYNAIDATILKKRPQPLSYIGDIGITTLCHVKGISFDPTFNIKDHVSATMKIADKSEQILIELFFSADKKLKDVKPSIVKEEDIKDEDEERIIEMAKTLTQQRISKAQKLKKLVEMIFVHVVVVKYKKCCYK